MRILTSQFLLVLFFQLANISLVKAQSPQLKWAQHYYGSSFVIGKSVATDSSGNVFSTGLFYGTVDFDPGSGFFTMTAEGSHDVFITKSDSAGHFIWAKHLGGIAEETPGCIAVDNAGNVYTSGYFTGTVDFNPGGSVFALTCTGIYDAFISKLDSNGNFVWAKQLDGTGSNNMGRSMVLNANGDIYLTGYFEGTTDFDPGIGITNISSTGSSDIFIAKYDHAGQLIWAKAVGGTSLDFGNSIVRDPLDNVYITGFYAGNVDFDPGSGFVSLIAAGTSAMFVMKLDASGNFKWARNFTGTSNVNGECIAIDSFGYIYTTGEFEGSVDFDPGAGTFVMSSVVSTDIFISKLDSSGNFVWVKNIWGTGEDQAASIASNTNGDIYLTGSFKGTNDFDPDAANSFVRSAMNKDIFIVKLDSGGNFKWATTIGGSSIDFGNCVAIDLMNGVYVNGVFSSPVVDFDPGLDTNNLYTQGTQDAFLVKLSQCAASNSSLPVTGCNAYTFNGITYTSSGVYPQPFVNISGCDSMVSLQLTIQTLDVQVTQTGDTLSANANGAAYQWIQCPMNTLIAGATNQNYIATSPGNYAVILTQGCTDTSECKLIASAGMNDIGASGNIKLFPNPCTTELTVSTGIDLMGGSIRIINCLGQETLKPTYLCEPALHINMSGHEPGLYFLELSKNGKTQRMKILKQ